MDFLRRASVLLAIGAVLAPTAHVLEMPNKLQLDGPLWLAVQQRLYRGWGPFIGAPTEMAALALSTLLLFYTKRIQARRFWLLAESAYAAMLIVFFVFNRPGQRGRYRLGR